MRKQIFLILMLVAGIAILSSCGGGQKPADDKKADTVPTVVNKTIENLMAAIKGETTASVKYAAYAQKAREEKLIPVAILFEAASAAEKIHATKHTNVLTKMGGKAPEFVPEFTVKTTKENLDDAIQGETHETTVMYPEFIAQADKDEFDDAVMTFTSANAVEKNHLALYAAAKKALDENKTNTLPASYSLCPVCGNTYDSKKVPAACEICSTPKEKFTLYKI
jgi:rubrerythrin